MIRVDEAGRGLFFIEDSSLEEWKMPLKPCVEGGANHRFWVQLNYVCFEILGREGDQEHEKWQWEEKTWHGFCPHWWVNCKWFVGIFFSWVFVVGVGVFIGMIENLNVAVGRIAMRRWNSWCRSWKRELKCVCFHEIFYLELLLLCLCCLLNCLNWESMKPFVSSAVLDRQVYAAKQGKRCSKCSCQFIFICTRSLGSNSHYKPVWAWPRRILQVQPCNSISSGAPLRSKAANGGLKDGVHSNAVDRWDD